MVLTHQLFRSSLQQPQETDAQGISDPSTRGHERTRLQRTHSGARVSPLLEKQFRENVESIIKVTVNQLYSNIYVSMRQLVTLSPFYRQANGAPSGSLTCPGSHRNEQRGTLGHIFA